MKRSKKLALGLSGSAVLLLLTLACGTAGDGRESDALQTGQSAPTAAVVVAADTGAGGVTHSAMTDGHMTGAVNVAHEEGDAHEAAMHADASEAITIEVTAYEWGFSPSSLDIPAGVPVKLVLHNEGKLEHEIQLVVRGAETVSSSGDHEGTGHQEGSETADHAQMAMSGDLGVIHVHTGVGETSSTVFVADEAGRYEFACEIPGHRAAGMVGQAVVARTGG